MSLDQFDLTAKRARLNPKKIAFNDLSSGVMRTYEQIDHRSSRLTSWLVDLGIKPKDRIAILCRNRIEFFEFLFACAKLGAILVPLNWRMPLAELAPICSDCAPKLIVYGREDHEMALALLQDQYLGLYLDGQDFEAKLAKACIAKTRAIWPGADIWYLLYTSGTTGTPKAVIQTYQMALVNSLNIGQAINISSHDRTLNFLPLFHTAGINLHTLPSFINGGCIKLLREFDADTVIKILAASEIDTFFAVPAVYQALAEHPMFAELRLDSIRSFGCGGAPMPDVLVQKFAAKGALVCNGMGMTETGPTLFLMDQEHVLDKIGSVGKPQLLSMVRIVDKEGKQVILGQDGELEVSGPGITPGYFQNQTETQQAFTKDGWLKTGDIAYEDEDGFFYIAGRLKQMFISGGENVFPAEIENVLAKHESVLEAVIIGVPDAKWGEVGHGFILLRQGHELNHHELSEFCRANLAPYKVPKSFSAVSDFPRTAAGKVRAHLLKAPRKPAP